MSETTARPRKPVPQLTDLPHRVTEIIRFGDLDPQGHVNNAVYATYFESGRVAMFRGPDLGIGVSDATFVLVRQEIDFLRELHWPGNIVIGSAVLEFGRSSFTIMHAIFRDDICLAAGIATLVMMDTKTRRGRPLPPETVARLENGNIAAREAPRRRQTTPRRILTPAAPAYARRGRRARR